MWLEDKHADIRARRGEDFTYAWEVGKKQLLCVEYIPANWPALTVWVSTKTVEEMKQTLREINFEIRE